MVAEKYPEMCGGEIALIGQTATDMRDIMVEGKSGIMATAKPWFEPIYEPSKMKITWPNGVVARLRTSEKPKLIRGLSVGFAWCDEIAHWMDPEECWSNLIFALREGNPSHIIATTTPLPTRFVRALAGDPDTKVIHGTTHENASNLDAKFIPNLEKKYGGTKKGRQEMGGEIVEDNEAAPFKTDWIGRIARDQMPVLAHIAVGIDPAGGTSSKNSDETGIIAMGICEAGNLYVLGDRSADMSSANWSRAAVELGMVLRADYSVETAVHVVGEVNFGGDMVERCLKTTPKWAASGLKYEEVRAFADKATRAEPIAQEAELGRYYHVGTGTHYRDLESQMTQFDPNIPRKKQSSPDRMDAMVHVATFLMSLKERAGKQMRKLSAAEQRAVLQKIASGYRM
jgi:phage terminase large subunit-like protein